ncbi:MAG: hypothetical protein A2854_03990 [Parcubacteria group bacterium RIFCSPHIGHO2_01_FULL_56_18]|nr:MAG: hypothetical protein A2854_03990 [Parcubacteria group bacterium RIFCSPHIGHO2_01_FULL_56_18]
MRTLFILQAVLIAIVGAVHIIALRLYLYWLFPWLDTFVHFAGALWVALAAVWLLAALHQQTSFIRILVILVLVSIGWELFEFWGGIPREANFAFDTSLDLLMDSLGGISGYLLARRIVARDTIGNHGTSQGDPSQSRLSA